MCCCRTDTRWTGTLYLFLCYFDKTAPLQLIQLKDELKDELCTLGSQ